MPEDVASVNQQKAPVAANPKVMNNNLLIQDGKEESFRSLDSLRRNMNGEPRQEDSNPDLFNRSNTNDSESVRYSETPVFGTNSIYPAAMTGNTGAANALGQSLLENNPL